MVSGGTVVRDCQVENFKTGIEVESPRAVVSHNLVCESTTDVLGTNASFSAGMNACDRASGWPEAEGRGLCPDRCASPTHRPG